MGTQDRSNSRRQPQLGAALAEFALVIPLLLLMCFGLIEYGRTLSELTWASNAAYHAVVLGSEASEDVGGPAMAHRVQLLQEGQPAVTSYLGKDSTYDFQSATVKVSLQGEVGGLNLGFTNLNYSSEIAGPWYAALASSVGDLNDFSAAPPPPSQYGCDGIIGSGDTDCIVALVPYSTTETSIIGSLPGGNQWTGVLSTDPN